MSPVQAPLESPLPPDPGPDGDSGVRPLTKREMRAIREAQDRLDRAKRIKRYVFGAASLVAATAIGTAQIDAFNADEANWCADAGSRATCLDHHTLLGISSTEKINSTVTNSEDLGSQCNGGIDHIHPGGYCTVKMADSFADNCP